jgi:gliding motility-associated-like protein
VYDPNLEPAFAGINASICASEFGQFNLQGNAVQSPAFGFWQVIDGPAEVLDSLDAETPVTTLGEILIELQGVPSTLVYTIDNGLCGITTDTVVYVLEDCLTIEIPDAFSPNADGVNDTWTIPNIASYPNNSLKIFNRWGAEVYSAAPYENEWAGISIHPATVGSELPVSTYYYILDLGEDGEVLNGFVYLKR